MPTSSVIYENKILNVSMMHRLHLGALAIVFIPFAMKNYIIHLSFIYRFTYRCRYLFILPFTLIGNNGYLFATAPEDKSQAVIVQKKEAVVRLYAQKRYAKANAEIELLLPLLKNRVDRSQFEFYQAYCNFYEKQYLASADQFHLFVKQYPSFPQVEEAFFMRGYSLACQNVDIRLEQTATYDAIRCLEHYIAAYPKGAYLHKAFDALQGLEERLMQKRFQAAALYVRLGYYHAAIVALKNFEEAYPETFLKEKVLRLLVKCYDKLAAAASNEEKKQAFMAYSCSFAEQLVQYLNDQNANAQAQERKTILHAK